MADSISGISGAQSVDIAKRNAQQREELKDVRAQQAQSRDPQDEVSISDEALQKADELARQQAAEARQTLTERHQETLGLNSDFDPEA